MKNICECGHKEAYHIFSCMLCGVDKCDSFRSQESWDSSEGQTHFQNDGCGEKEHNDPAKLIEPPSQIPPQEKKCEWIPCGQDAKYLEPSGDGRLVNLCTSHRRLLRKQKQINGE